MCCAFSFKIQTEGFQIVRLVSNNLSWIEQALRLTSEVEPQIIMLGG
jgi:hypothetical protein